MPAPAPPATAEAGTDIQSIARVDDRTLVVIELEGGNDGLATLVPHSNGRLRDLRSATIPDNEQLVALDDDWSLHKGLEPMTAHSLALVQGLGSTSPDYSHFEMSERWWSGDPAGNLQPRSGVLGRICDALDQGSALTGVTMHNAPSRALLAERAGTGVLPDPGAAWFLDPRNEEAAVQRRRKTLVAMGDADDDTTIGGEGSAELLALARAGVRSSVDLADLLIDLEAEDSSYNDTTLGNQLALAARLIDAEVGTRVIHLNQGGYDTHGSQRGSHDQLMDELGSSVGAFLDDLADRGRGGQVLVATTSEFGRRVEENDGEGTDHGGASVAMMCGPVRAGRHGEPASLENLIDDGNLAATRNFTDYQATLASWFELDPAQVIGPDATPIEQLLA